MIKKWYFLRKKLSENSFLSKIEKKSIFFCGIKKYSFTLCRI